MKFAALAVLGLLSYTAHGFGPTQAIILSAHTGGDDTSSDSSSDDWNPDGNQAGLVSQVAVVQDLPNLRRPSASNSGKGQGKGGKGGKGQEKIRANVRGKSKNMDVISNRGGKKWAVLDDVVAGEIVDCTGKAKKDCDFQARGSFKEDTLGRRLMGAIGHYVSPGVYTWANGIVPYQMNSAEPLCPDNKWDEAVAWINANTDIRMIRRTDETAYILLEGLEGSASISALGRWSDDQQPQPLGLGTSGVFLHVVLHEILHALGLSHEHQRPDRDQYVTVHDNILADYMDQYATEESDTSHGDYEIGSLMHYSGDEFSTDGSPTMTSLSGLTMGNDNGPTAGDLAVIAFLYPGLTPAAAQSPTTPTAGDCLCVDKWSNCGSYFHPGPQTSSTAEGTKCGQTLQTTTGPMVVSDDCEYSCSRCGLCSLWDDEGGLNCQNGGWCENGVCACPDGFSGHWCEVDASACQDAWCCDQIVANGWCGYNVDCGSGPLSGTVQCSCSC